MRELRDEATRTAKEVEDKIAHFDSTIHAVSCRAKAAATTAIGAFHEYLDLRSRLRTNRKHAPDPTDHDEHLAAMKC